MTSDCWLGHLGNYVFYLNFTINDTLIAIYRKNLEITIKHIIITRRTVVTVPFIQIKNILKIKC